MEFYVRDPTGFNNSGYYALLHTSSSGQNDNTQPHLWDTGCQTKGQCMWSLK
jgi:hypothetical protein